MIIYTLRQLPYKAPDIDIGTVDEILMRAWAENPGPLRNKFREAAANKICVRVGYNVAAVDPEEMVKLIERIQRLLPSNNSSNSNGDKQDNKVS